MVVVLSATSVRVSWTNIEMSQFMDYIIHGYTVYYSKTMTKKQEMSVNSTKNGIVITNLISDTEYVFQVAGIVELDGRPLMAGRSSELVAHTITYCKLSAVYIHHKPHSHEDFNSLPVT